MDLGPMGRGGARRRTRRRMTAMQAARSNNTPQAPNSNTQSSMNNDPASMLEMLKVLHDAGILSDDEFSAKKMQVVDLM